MPSHINLEPHKTSFTDDNYVLTPCIFIPKWWALQLRIFSNNLGVDFIFMIIILDSLAVSAPTSMNYGCVGRGLKLNKNSLFICMAFSINVYHLIKGFSSG